VTPPARRRSAMAGAGPWITALLAAGALVADCGASGHPASSPPERTPVDVLYAGSLAGLMEDHLGPAFTSTTGYRFSGFGAGSSELANEIKGEVRQGDVFISASPDVDRSLEGAVNGNWMSWDAEFATSALVLGYNPKSPFAEQLRSRAWYRVVAEPGFRLGRTDPALDPKGELSVQALRQAGTDERVPALLQLAQNDAEVFPEETLIGRLSAGQLDAGFFYASEAKQAGIPTVSLAPVALSASYTVSVLERAPHELGAEAFVAFLLGPQGRALLAAGGLTVAPRPVAVGSGIPAALRTVLERP
jgi:molybdate/tungstate transport system substrate-binding protein